MIKDPSTAAEVNEQLLKASTALNQALFLVRDKCSEEEFSAFRLSTGKVLGEMLFELLNPLYAKHPELMPPGFDGR